MKYLAVLLILLAPLPAFSQATSVTESWGVISGRVLDASTGKPLGYCNVMIDSLALGTYTDEDGRFVLRFIPPGTYKLIVAHITHEMYQESGIVVEPGKLVSRTIRLPQAILEAEPVVVTATRRPQTAKMTPASVMIVNREDMSNRQRTTFDQTIESVSGVAAFRSSPISVQSMSIRGASDVAGGGVGNRVLLLVDGRPALTADSGGAFWSLVPTHFIDRVEVVKGAFSSLYGSTAMGGVVNVITRRPDYESKLQLDMRVGYFELPAGIPHTGDTPMQNEIQAHYSGASKRVSYLFSASRKQSDGHAERTAYEFYDLYSKILFDLRQNRNLELTFGGGASENDYPHTWLNSAEPLSVRAKFTDDRQEKKYLSGDVYYWAVPTEKLKYSSRFYLYQHKQRSFFNESDPSITLPGNEPLGTGTKVDGTKLGNITQIDYYLGDKNYIITGFDAQIDAVESSPDTIMYGNRQINNFAVFAQDDIDLTSTLSATIGGRYDWNHLDGRATIGQFSPKVALMWAPVSRLSFRGLYGRAFRAPTIAELFFQKEIAGGTEFVPNPNLSAERMTVSLEGGVRWTPTGNLNFDAAVFRYEYEDMIYWENVSNEYGVGYPLFQVRNLNSALIEGAELTVQTGLTDHLTLSGNYTYLDAKDRSPNRLDGLLPYRPRHLLNFAVDAAWFDYFFHVDTRYRSEIEEVFLYPLQAPDAFWVTNANLRYELGEHMLLSATVNNVFNAQYEELARYRMPGRNWIFGVSYRY